VGSASRRANAVSNGSGRAERDIEAELLEDAGLTRGARAPWDQASASPTGRGAAPGAGVTGDTPDPADDDALWSRWHRTGGGTLDPLSDPPPTQAYRLEPDGGWSA
jgi:hypothetical protein